MLATVAFAALLHLFGGRLERVATIPLTDAGLASPGTTPGPPPPTGGSLDLSVAGNVNMEVIL